MAESPNHNRPPRPSASAEGAAIRWSETHPDEDVPHVPPSTPPESEDVVPNRHSASAEAAALRLREREDDSKN